MEANLYGSALRAARKSLGLSVARTSGRVGVSPATVKRWEAGLGLPPRRELLGYLDGIGLPAGHPARALLQEGRHPTGRKEARERVGERPLLRLLRARRRRAGISLTDLAAGTGLSPASLHRYETGERTPDPPTLAALGLAVGCSPKEAGALCRACELPPTAGEGPGFGLAGRFLDSDNLASIAVFAEVDALALVPENASPQRVLQVLECLLIMAGHSTVRELWPTFKAILARQLPTFEEKVVIQTTAATAWASFGRSGGLDAERADNLAQGVRSLRPGLGQMRAMLHMARLDAEAENIERARLWVSEAQRVALQEDHGAIAYLCELNQFSLDLLVSGSRSALQGIACLRESARGSLQAYTASVAQSQAFALGGDRTSTRLALEDCALSERLYGCGSPLADRLRVALSVA